MAEQVNTFSISKLQRAFDLTVAERPYFFVNSGREPIYTDEPFRTETYSIVWLREGFMSLEVDLTEFKVTGPSIITIGPNSIRSFNRVDQLPDMQVFFFKGEYLVETLANIFYLERFNFFEDNNLHVLSIEPGEGLRLASTFDLISNTFDSGHINENFLMRSYGLLLLYEIEALHKSRHLLKQWDESNLLFSRFRNLLTKEFWKHRTVSFYADKLNVTSKYLSEVVKRQSGKTAGEWIDKAILLEAKVLLQNKALSVSEISDKLHFSDQSVFGKFFKAQEGRSPLEYRKNIFC